MGEITLFIGGIRSGKSAAAVCAARAHGDDVVVIATGAPSDPEMAARIEAHRAQRPAAWETVETADVPGAVAAAPPGALVLVDGLGGWAAGLLQVPEDGGGTAGGGSGAGALLVAVLTARPGPALVVTDEVGLSLVPQTEAGRRFTDVLGDVNQTVAAAAASVRFYVAGRCLEL